MVAVWLAVAQVGAARVAHGLIVLRLGGRAEDVDALAEGAARRIVHEAIRIIAEIAGGRVADRMMGGVWSMSWRWARAHVSSLLAGFAEQNARRWRAVAAGVGSWTRRRNGRGNDLSATGPRSAAPAG